MSLFRRKPKVDAIVAAEVGPRWANVAVGAILTAYGHTVTYSPEDLVFVDQALSDLAATGDLASKTQTIQAFGCLVGEILVRNDGGKWLAFDAADADAFGVSIGVELPNGRLTNPIGAAFKRANGGEDRSVLRFREAVLGPLDSEYVKARD